jgi:hypothetical protein
VWVCTRGEVEAKDKISNKVLPFLNVGKRKTYAKCVALFKSTKLFLRICVEVFSQGDYGALYVLTSKKFVIFIKEDARFL